MSTSRRSALIVEDEAVVAAGLAGRLERLGYRIAATAASGEDAVGLARTHRPDLVLMDICLGGTMDGLAAAIAIRGDLDVPVVFVTAHSDAATINEARRTGASGLIRKRFDDGELGTRVRQALHSHSAGRARHKGGR